LSLPSTARKWKKEGKPRSGWIRLKPTPLEERQSKKKGSGGGGPERFDRRWGLWVST